MADRGWSDSVDIPSQRSNIEGLDTICTAFKEGCHWGRLLRSEATTFETRKHKHDASRCRLLQTGGEVVRRLSGWDRRRRSWRLGQPARFRCLAWPILVMTLALWGTTRVHALKILYPDGVALADEGMPVVVPAGRLLLGFSGSYGGSRDIEKGDAVSIIRGDQSCRSRANLDGTPQGVSNILLDAQRRASFDFSSSMATAGYKLCVCPSSTLLTDSGIKRCPDGEAFEEASRVTVQNLLSGINFKGIIAGIVTIPIQNASCWGPTCPNTHTLSDVRYWSTVDELAYISIIKTSKQCTSMVDNPNELGETTSGYLQANWPSRLISNFERVSSMDPGTYKICIKGKTQAWQESGMIIMTQNKVSSISINGIVEISGAVARKEGSTISVCRNFDCSVKIGPAVKVSLIPFDYSCWETQDKNPSSRPSDNSAGISGHLQANADGALSQATVDTLLTNARGVLQMCISTDVAEGFVPTGIHLEIQDDVLGLELNDVSPRKWWHVSAPKTSGTRLRYLSEKSGTPGDSFALIRLGNVCASLCTTRSKRSCTNSEIEKSASGFWSAHGIDKVLSSDECLTNNQQMNEFACRELPTRRSVDMARVAVNVYKVCFRRASPCPSADCWPEWQGTGIQVQVQDLLTEISINGAGGALNPAQAQRLVIPRMSYHTFKYFGSCRSRARLQILRKNDECSDFTVTSPNMPLLGNHLSGAIADEEMRGDLVDKLLDLSVGVYQVCFLPFGNITFYSTGISLTIQDYMDGLEVNGIRPNRGLRITIPRRKSSRLTFFRRGQAIEIGDKVSFIELEHDCSNPEHNGPLQTCTPSTCSSGHMSIRALPLIGNAAHEVLIGTESLAAMTPKVYKVCFKAATGRNQTVWWDNTFQETGLTLTVQTDLQYAMINVRDHAAIESEWNSATFTPSNLGVRLTAPKADNILFTMRKPGTISLIESDKDCSSTSSDGENPPAKKSTPMYISTEALAHGSSLFAVQRNGLNQIIGKFGVKNPAMYQLCFAPSNGDKKGRFAATGISLHLQDMLTQVIVNGVRPNFGLRAALPKSSKNTVSFEGSSMGAQAGQHKVEKLYSLIKVGYDCSMITDNNDNNQSAQMSGYMRSGLVEPSNFSIPVAQTDRIRDQAKGLYQVCYRRRVSEGILFADTGLMVTVQDEILRLKVNGIPKIPSVIPKVKNNNVFWCKHESCADLERSMSGQAGIPSESFISFIVPYEECEDVLRANAKTAIPERSGHISTTYAHLRTAMDEEGASLDSSLYAGGTLYVGIYQVCFGTSSSTFISTGLSLLVQDYLTQMIINGVSPGFGVNVAIPKGSITPSISYGSPELGKSEDRVSFIPVHLDCDDTTHNPSLASPASSGHLESTGQSKALVGTETVKGLNVDLYQVCFKGKQNTFATTGISAKIQKMAADFSGDVKTHTAVVKKSMTSSLTFFGEKPLSSVSWPPAKASLIPASDSCTDFQSNPPLSGPDTSGHLDVYESDTDPTGSFDIEFDSEGSTLSELLYQFCIYVGSEWYSTGLAVQVEWESVSDANEISFVFVNSQESSRLQGSSNAIHVLMKTEQVLNPGYGGILRIGGLLGSQTKDSPEFDVEGNSVEEESVEFTCVGNGTCTVTSPMDYIESGKMLMRAELEIQVACTDLDTTCTQCEGDSQVCSEGIISAFLANEETVRDITSIIERGPWKGCLNKCQDTRTIISAHDILDLSTKAGKPVTISLTAADTSSYYTCDHEGSPFTLKAYVTIRMLVSTLSTNLLKGSFSSISGRLTVLNVPFDNSEYIHVTFILQNSFSTSPPRVPTAEILAVDSWGFAVRKRPAIILPKRRPGILRADQMAQFVNASLQMGSIYTGEKNRVTLNLKSNFPAVFPAEVAVTISGLVGTNTADNARLATVANEPVGVKTFECVGGKHCIVDVDVKPMVHSADLYKATLDIDVFCTDFASYPDKYIQKINFCSTAVGQTTCPTMKQLTVDEASYSRGPWQNCGLCSTSTRTVMKDYDLSEILKLYDTSGTRKFAIELFASEHVADLKCYGSSTTQAVKALVTVRIEHTRTQARWLESTGTLTAQISPIISKCSSLETLSCLPDVSFSFEIRNPDAPNSGPVQAQVSARGGGLVFKTIDLASVFHIVGPRIPVEIAESSIRENTRVKGALNTLVLSIKFRGRLSAGTILTVSGLIGTQTASILCDTAIAPRCGTNDCIFSPADSACRNGLALKGHTMGSSAAAAWNQATGTLKFMVMKSFANAEYLEFNFDVVNAARAQAANSISISGSGNGFLVPSKEVKGTILTSDIDPSRLTPLQPSISSAHLQERNKIEYESNSLTAELRLNVPLAAGSKIEISKMDNVLILPSTGEEWYSDALPNVQKINVKSDSDVNIRSLGQFSGQPLYHMPWLCRDDGWGVELNNYYKDGHSTNACEMERLNRGGVLPLDCASFYRKTWCIEQTPHSLAVFVDQCLKEFQPVSFSFEVKNGPIPPSFLDTPPVVTVDGGSVTTSTPFKISPLFRAQTRECVGVSSCMASFVQDERFLDSQRRFLPPSAFIKEATLSIQLACSSFSNPDQFLQRISICNLPDCKATYGNDYEWNQELNSCCNDVGTCRLFVCTDPVPIPPGKSRAFVRGPWLGCQENCSESRVVMDLYDMMPVICQAQSDCLKPKSFAVFISATGAADTYPCFIKSSISYFLSAQIHLKMELSYKSAAFASEPVRLESVKVYQSTNTTQALSKFNFIVKSMVAFPKDSVLIVSGLTGSMTPDGINYEGTRFGSQLEIVHPDCNMTSLIEERIRIPCSITPEFQFTLWNQSRGELRLKLLKDITAEDDLKFAFALRNAAREQSPQVPKISLKLGGSDGKTVGPSSSSSPVLTSHIQSLVTEGKVFESTQVRRRLNRITVSFCVNYHLFQGSTVSVQGFLHSGNASNARASVVIDEQTVNGNWNRTTGTLGLQVPNSYEPGEAVVFSFIIQNPREEQRSTLILRVSSATPASDETVSFVLSQDGFKASQQASFLESSLKQKHALADQLNEFECTFTLLDDLPVGSIIMISGLIGTQTPSTDSLAVRSNDTYGILHDFTAQWNTNLGVLTFFQHFPLPAGGVVRIFFDLMNPKVKGPHRIAKLSVYSGLTTIAMHPVGSVLDASDIARFLDARIGESSRVPSGANVMTLIFELNLGLKPSVHEIHITGLLQPSVTTLLIEGPSSDNFISEIPLDSQKLVLFPTEASQSKTRYVLNWVLANPAAPRASANVEIGLFNTERKFYDIQPTKIKGSALSATLNGIVLSAVAEESSKTKGAKNRLTVKLKFNYALSYQTSITLVGLTDTPVEAASLRIWGRDSDLFRDAAHSSSYGAWTQTTGTLVLTFLKRTIIDAMTDVVFEFELANPKATSTEKPVFVTMPQFLSQPKAFASKVLLASEEPAFTLASISESTAVADVLNTITVQLSANAELAGGGVSKVTISGLPKYQGQVTVQPPDTVTLETFQRDKGFLLTEWYFLVVVLLKPVLTNTISTFAFTMRNAAEGRAAFTPWIAATSVGASGDPIEFPDFEMTGSVLSASEPKRFIVTDVQESSKIQGTSNTITIVLRANFPFANGATITISNLRGSQTATTPCLDVTSGWVKYDCGDWNIDGTLVLTVGSSGFEAYEDLKFSFTLINPTLEQDGVVPIISASEGVRKAALISAPWHDGINIWRGDQHPTSVVGPLLSASEPHEWLSAFVEESSGIAGQSNSLLIDMIANTALPAESIVTVSGLTGTTQEDTELFEIVGQNGKDAELGRWSQNTGVLVFRLKAQIPHSSKFSFVLQLRNPLSPQKPVRPSISLSVATRSDIWRINPRQAQIREGAEECCLASRDFPRFKLASVRESTSVKSALNVLHFTFRTNIAMSTQTSITISGLKGTLTPDNNFLVLMNSTHLHGTWIQNGVLVLMVHEDMYQCDCIDLCVQNNLEIHFQVRNSATEQERPVIHVTAEGPDVKIGETLVVGSILRSQTDPALIASVYESSKVSAEKNNITMRLLVNSDLDICVPSWRRDKSWVSSLQTAVMTELNGESPDSVTELGKLFDGRTDTDVSIKQDHPNDEIVYIYFDLGQVFRLEAISVTADNKKRSSVKDIQLQFATSPSAPESQWKLAAFWTVGLTSSPVTSPRFDHYARFWRLRLLNNVGGPQSEYPQSTSLSEVNFYGCPDVETATITISNLTVSNGEVKLYDVHTRSGAFRLFGYQSADELSIKVSRSIRAFDEIMFTFTTENTPKAQSAKQAGVSVNTRNFKIPRTFAFGSMLTSDEDARFIQKDINEDNKLQSDSSTLEIKLRANVQLNPEDTFRIIFEKKYVADYLNADQEMAFCVDPNSGGPIKYPPCVENNGLFRKASWYFFTDKSSLGYSDGKPSLIVVLDKTIPRYSEIRLQMIVKNPPQRQEKGLVPEIEGTKVEGTRIKKSRMDGSVMQAPLAGPSFAKRIIHHSSDMAGAKNTITVTLAPGSGADLPGGTQIIICGLRGTDSDANNMQTWPKEKTLLTSAPIGRFLETYKIDRTSAGKTYEDELMACVTLTLSSEPWIQGSTASFSFEFKNPTIILSDRPALFVVATQKITIEMPLCKEMKDQDTTRCVKNSDALWTRREAGFMNMHLKQDNTAVKQLSTYSVALVPNVIVIEKTKMIIRGLKGLSADASIMVIGPIAHLLDSTWNPVEGRLELQTKGTLNSVGSRALEFEFKVFNPAAIQDDSNIELCSQFAVPSEGFVDISAGNESMGGANCSHPLSLGKMVVNEQVKFVLKRVSESSQVQNEDNILTLELSSNFAMNPGVVLTFTGLTGSQTQTSNGELQIFSSYPSGVKKFEIASEWRQAEGQLTVTLSEQVSVKPFVFMISLVLQNPKSNAESSSTGVSLTVQNVGEGFDFILEPLDGKVLQALSSPGFTLVQVEEQTKVNLQFNTITLKLTSNVGLVQGGILTLSGLVGRDQEQVDSQLTTPCVANEANDVNTTYNLTPLQLSFMSREGQFGNQTSTENSVTINSKSCLQVDSSIKVSVPFFVKPASILTVTFRVVNWKAGIAGATPQVSFSGCRPKVTVLGDLDCQTNCCIFACSCSKADSILIAPASAKMRILTAGISPQITLKRLGESTTVVSQQNKISVTLAVNFQLTVGSKLTIRGLQDSQTPSDTSLLITGDSASLFDRALISHGVWNRLDGQLILTIDRLVDSNETLTFDFELLNRGIRDPARCRYGANFCQGKGAYNEGRSCPNLGGICSGFCAGGKPYCTTESLSGSCDMYTSDDLKDPIKKAEADDLCLGGVCVEPNNGHQCPSDAMVNTTNKIKARLIDPAVEKVQILYFGKTVFLQGADCTGSDISCKGASQCVAPNEGAECTKNVQCTGEFDPSLKNTKENFNKRAGSQRCVRLPRERAVEVYIESERANISWTRLSGNVNGLTSPDAPEFVTRALKETSTIAGARNELTISLTSNFRLANALETNLTLIGLPLHKYGLGSKVPILPADLQVKNKTYDFIWQGSTVTCEKIGLGSSWSGFYDSKVLLSAVISLEIECKRSSADSCQGKRIMERQEDCVLIESVQMQTSSGRIALPIGSFSASPCIDTAEAPCRPSVINDDTFVCPIITDLDVVEAVLADSNGISLTLLTNMISSQLTVQAVLEYTETSEHAEYQIATQTLKIAGRNAQSMMQRNPDGRTIIITIPLTNSPSPQTSPTVTVLGESGLIKDIGICEDEVTPGCETPGLPSQVLAIMTGQVLTSTSEGPMRFASIEESINVQGFTNVITVELEAETEHGSFVNILAGSTITISGLTGSATASTDELLINGHRISRQAKWDQVQGSLCVKVNAMPHSPHPTPLRFSFELLNPKTSHIQLEPTVLVTGAIATHGGKTGKLVCKTLLGCTSVLAANQIPRFTSVQVFESTRYVGHDNMLSFFLASDLPLQSQSLRITVTGIEDGKQEMTLSRSPGTSRRVQQCQGVNGCVLQQDLSPVLGTVVTKIYIDLILACTFEDTTSLDFGKYIQNLEVYSVSFCGERVEFKNQNRCSMSEKSVNVLQAFEVALTGICAGSDYLLIRIQGRGPINMTSILNVDYVFDTSSSLVYDASNHSYVLNIVSNTSDHAPATRDLRNLAFSLAYKNAPSRRETFKPTVQAHMPQGIVISPAEANPSGKGVGGSGIRYCTGVQVIGNQTYPGVTQHGEQLRGHLPVENGDLNEGQTLRVYHEIKNDGVEECIFILQPDNPNKYLLKLTVHEYDVDENLEMVEVFSGDSPAAPRMGILYSKTSAFQNNPIYFASHQDIFVNECAVTLRLLVRRLVLPGQQRLLNYVNGRVGFALTYKLIDPNKMDHFKAKLKFSGMVDSVTEVSVQLKLRKIFASFLDLMYASIRFEKVEASRRGQGLLVDEFDSRRASTMTAMLRFLCTSPLQTSELADKFAKLLNAELMTGSMNAAGIPGTVALVPPMIFFRCGKELACVPTTPAPPPVVKTTPVPTPAPPVPFPLYETIQLSLGVVVGPIIVGLIALLAYLWFKRKASQKLRAKREQAIEAFNTWIDDKIDDLEEKSGFELGKLAEAKGLVDKEGWKEDEMTSLIPDLARCLYRHEQGFGKEPEGIFKYVPESLYKTASISAKKDEAKRDERKLSVGKDEHTAQTRTGDFSSGQDTMEARNQSVAKQRKILWIKRAAGKSKKGSSIKVDEQVAV